MLVTLQVVRDAFYRPDMRTPQSRQVIFCSRIAGVNVLAQGARDRAKQAVREADRAEAAA
jgi:hypothetical protein